MASKITIKRSTAALPPAGLSFGELAFVQGTGLTANQLYVGLTGASPVWVGAQISTTGSWTDNAAKTSLATQYAIDQRISSQISGGSPITTVSDNTNTTRYLVLSTSAAAGVTLFVDDTTGPLSYNPSTGALGLNGSIELGHATDTTIARVSAGVVSIEGVNVVTTSSTDTFSNKTFDLVGSGNALKVLGVTLNAISGSGAIVLANSPTLVTPALGTPSALVGTNITGTATSFTASSCTTIPGLTGAITNLGNTTYLGSFSSANLASALTDETGTGGAVFANSPTLVTPALGTPSALVGTNITGTATSFTASNVTTNANLTGAITSVGNGTTLGSFSSAQLLTALTDETGSGLNVFGTAPSLSLPRYSISATVSAAGTVQGTATALTSDINVITTATFGSATGVVLPTAVAGMRVLVRNAHATVGINVYPASGASIDNDTVNVAKAMPVLQTLEFVAISSTEWQSNVRVTDSQILRNNTHTVDNSSFNFSGTTLSSKRSYIFPDSDGTIALTNTKLSGFASSTSAELASVISDKTGNTSGGILVFNKSPAIATSLTTASASFDLLNTTATTVNFAGGASTALNIGNASSTATFAGNVTVTGDLTVNGTTTTLNTTTLNVEDFNITMGLTLTSATQCTGAGIGIGVGTGITFAYNHPTTSWLSSVDLDLATAKVYKIGGTSVLSSSALGSGVTGSSLTQVGTITSGTWSGSFGAVSGANLTTLTAGNLSGTIPSGVLGNSSVFIGTTSVALNRGTGALSLTGVNIDGSAGSATTAGTATTATNATNVAITTENSDVESYITFVTTNSSGNQAVKVSSQLQYNALTGELSATLIDGGSF
jgi:hypothetical protein